jgi:hypothetical protein
MIFDNLLKEMKNLVMSDSDDKAIKVERVYRQDCCLYCTRRLWSGSPEPAPSARPEVHMKPAPHGCL